MSRLVPYLKEFHFLTFSSADLEKIGESFVQAFCGPYNPERYQPPGDFLLFGFLYGRDDVPDGSAIRSSNILWVTEVESAPASSFWEKVFSAHTFSGSTYYFKMSDASQHTKDFLRYYVAVR